MAGRPYIVYVAGRPYIVYVAGRPYIVYAAGRPYIVYAAGRPYIVYAAGGPYIVYAAGRPYIVYAAGRPYIVYAAGRPYVYAAGRPRRPAPAIHRCVVGGFQIRRDQTPQPIAGNAWRAVWQRNYYEQIIRDEASLYRIRAYIAANPARWSEAFENPTVIPPESVGD